MWHLQQSSPRKCLQLGCWSCEPPRKAPFKLWILTQVLATSTIQVSRVALKTIKNKKTKKAWPKYFQSSHFHTVEWFSLLSWATGFYTDEISMSKLYSGPWWSTCDRDKKLQPFSMNRGCPGSASHFLLKAQTVPSNSQPPQSLSSWYYDRIWVDKRSYL